MVGGLSANHWRGCQIRLNTRTWLHSVASLARAWDGFFAGTTLTRTIRNHMPKLTAPCSRAAQESLDAARRAGEGALFSRRRPRQGLLDLPLPHQRQRARESLGPYPELKLDEARAKHAALRAMVPTSSIRSPTSAPRSRGATSSMKPTFGVMADEYVATHEGGSGNPKHRWQWTQTLTSYCAPDSRQAGRSDWHRRHSRGAEAAMELAPR